MAFLNWSNRSFGESDRGRGVSSGRHVGSESECELVILLSTGGILGGNCDVKLVGVGRRFGRRFGGKVRSWSEDGLVTVVEDAALA